MATPQAPAASVAEAFATAAASLVEGDEVVDIDNRLLRSAFATSMAMADQSGQSLSVVAEQVLHRAIAP